MPTKSIAVRMSEELLQYLQKRAQKENRSLSNLISTILLAEKEADKTISQIK